jgi:hypothetical protein
MSEELDAEIRTLKNLAIAQQEDLERQRAVWQEHFDHMAVEMEAFAKGRADGARNAALEEAADVAEAFEIEWREGIDGNRSMIVKAIRDLKDKPHG